MVTTKISRLLHSSKALAGNSRNTINLLQVWRNNWRNSVKCNKTWIWALRFKLSFGCRADKEITPCNRITSIWDKRTSTGLWGQSWWIGWCMFVFNSDWKDKLTILLLHLWTSIYKKPLISPNLISSLLAPPPCSSLLNSNSSKPSARQTFQNPLTIVTPQSKSDKLNLKYADAWTINSILPHFTCGQIDSWSIGTTTLMLLMLNSIHTSKLTNTNFSKNNPKIHIFFLDKWYSSSTVQILMFKHFNLLPKY